MNRIVEIAPDQYNADQKRMADTFQRVIGEPIRGPFALWLGVPHVGVGTTEMFEGFRKRGKVDRRLDELATLIVAQLLFLEAENPKKEISMYINSPGGVVTSGLAIYDTMQYIRPQISTLVFGQAASAGSLLLMAGVKGKRFSLPNARIMIHQPSGGAQGQATDIEIHAKEILQTRARLNQMYVHHTGRTIEEIERAMERDKFFSPPEAKEFGLIDDVLENRPVPTIQAAAS